MNPGNLARRAEPTSWLWRKTGEYTERHLVCTTCGQLPDTQVTPLEDAAVHVRTTGHTVHVIRNHVTTLEGMTTDARINHL